MAGTESESGRSASDCAPGRDWPDLLLQVVDALGQGAALALAREFGGTEVYLPAPVRIDSEHRLARALGLDNAQKIAGLLGPGRVLVPLGASGNGRRRARVLDDALAEGASAAEAARRAGCHIRTAYRHRERVRDERQGRLFEVTLQRDRGPSSEAE